MIIQHCKLVSASGSNKMLRILIFGDVYLFLSRSGFIPCADLNLLCVYVSSAVIINYRKLPLP